MERRLRLSNVTFGYRRGAFSAARRAIGVFRDFTWQVPPGRTVLLGPNGAGKTTLLALAATALPPAAGTIAFGELELQRRRDRTEMRRLIGLMPQAVHAVPGFTSQEQVAYAGWLKGMSRSTAWRQASVALDRVGLRSECGRLTSELSGGQRHRVGLAQLLVHDSELLLLDEPTAGLDPTQRARFRDLVREIGGSRPVVASTHQVDDLDDLFETVVVIVGGAIVFQGTVADFLRLAAPNAPFAAESAYASLVRDPE